MSYKASYSDMNQKPDADADEGRSRKLRQKRIGDQLRRLYDDVTSEPVPDEFLSLLEQADNSSKNKK
ncbi:NepR family anti-sigma factor [Henriciella litoralis]|uniref:NepR family anti-sigma factor n=1 Tax=Henriciella litoralis TaxID=568102 RepID=UPI000A020994|nr:NepR family anti-sigma factor [Henriciella litoralis]